jgi:hypothetical protein
MNNETWIQNDQYVLQSDKKVTVHIVFEQEIEKATDALVYIFKGNNQGTKVYHGERADEKNKISFKALHLRAIKFTLEANTPYSLMPSTFKQNIFLDYKLKVCWLKDKNVNVTLKSCKSMETISFDDQWTSLTAGGCANDQTSWLKNPKYTLNVEHETNLQVMLIQKGKEPFPIGFHVLKGDLKNMNIVAQPKSYNYSKVIVEDFKIPSGTYTLVPSTFNPNEKCGFTIQVSSFKKGDFSFNKN